MELENKLDYRHFLSEHLLCGGSCNEYSHSKLKANKGFHDP